MFECVYYIFDINLPTSHTNITTHSFIHEEDKERGQVRQKASKQAAATPSARRRWTDKGRGPPQASITITIIFSSWTWWLLQYNE
jgi:hypothetical protein